MWLFVAVVAGLLAPPLIAVGIVLYGLPSQGKGRANWGLVSAFGKGVLLGIAIGVTVSALMIALVLALDRLLGD